MLSAVSSDQPPAATPLSGAEEAWRRSRAARIATARHDVNAFVELALRDEQNGTEIEQAPVHVEWQRLAARHKRLVMWAPPSIGKTQNLAVGRVLWLLGRNPNLRLAVVSRTTDLARKILRTVGAHIERNEFVRAVFPELEPDRRLPWTQQQLYVRRPFASKDASLQAFGVGSSGLHGSRLDGVLLDDVVDYDSSRTKARRDEVAAWFSQITEQRVSEDGWILAIGNAFHPDDLLHRLARRAGYTARRFPIVNDRGESLWPGRWTPERIAEKRAATPALVWAQQFLCDARDDETSAFRREWIDSAVSRGTAETLAQWREVPVKAQAECCVVTGVDLAISRKDAADLTVLFSMALYRNGDRRVLGIQSGHWSFPETIDRITETHARIGGIFMVENNGYQQAVVDQIQRTTGIRVFGAATSAEKHHPTLGIPAIAMDIRNGKWIVPGDGATNVAELVDPELRGWLDEMLYFKPDGHVGDRLMACYMAERAISLGYAKPPKAKAEPTLTELRIQADERRRRAERDPW